MARFSFTTSPTLVELVCRLALPQDTAAILELSRHIWNGHDYIPFVWQEWLADADGFLAVAEYGSRIAGMGKLTRLAEDEWWLEGLHVHPDFEGRGFATHIHRYLMERWKEKGKGVIRLATASKRIAVHRICHKLGFQKVAEFSAYERSPLTAGDGGAFTLIRPQEADEAFAKALSSPLLPLCFNLIDLDWQWAQPRLSYLQRRVEARQAYWWRERQGILCVAEDEEETKSLMMRWVACQPEVLSDLLEDFSRFAAERGYEKAAWLAPVQPTVLTALQKAAFQPAWEMSLFVFEFRREESRS